MKKQRKDNLVLIGVLIGVLLVGFVLAGNPPQWIAGSHTVNYTTIEDFTYYHNFSVNITGYNSDIIFDIDTSEGNYIYWNNASGRNTVSEDVISSWIAITNSSTGNLTINAIYDNQTGFFEIPIQATNTTGGDSGATTVSFEFVVNATNDDPAFTNINNTYEVIQDRNLFDYLNASDEEEHYPLIFNVSFFSNCTHADWAGRVDGENCSLLDFGLNLTNIANTSASMNFTPGVNEVGTYWANITVMDFGNSSDYGCPHQYCDNATYNLNQTTVYSQVVVFDVLSTLSINISDCQNKTLNESEEFTCQINITSIGNSDSLNISTLADLRNYDGYISNTSWFYSNNSTSSTDFFTSIDINVTPQKTEVGNWTINFTVFDITYNESVTEQIYVQVNRNSTLNDVPNLDTVSAVTTSINLETTINLTVYDEDLKIPDKNESFGGYNETINFTVQIFNMSDFGDVKTLNNFTVDILYMPVVNNSVLTNITTAQIVFTPNSTESGNYTINITVNDEDGTFDNQLFNLTILDNDYPFWNLTTTDFSLTEGTLFNLNLSLNVTDPDGDTLTFSYTNDTEFLSFNLNATTGIINFTAIDEDVGQHLVTITVSDGYLTNSTLFNFTVLNINDAPVIKTPLEANNATVNISNSNMNTTEDAIVEIYLFIQDDDFKIPSNQKDFYNESLNVSVNITGPNTDLFNFTIDNAYPTEDYPNKTKYTATFTPRKADVGDYNITINVTDNGNVTMGGMKSDFLSFNLTVLEIEHAPVLMELTNQTSAVNRSFYYMINATDQEDGNSNVTGGNTNFTFSYDFLSGTDFINNNQSIFNLTTGELNITFNDSHGGEYHINITVNDSLNLTDSDDFWFFVYDAPNVTFPVSGENFSLQENTTSNLTFQVNHSVGNNLTYLFYIDDTLRGNTTYYGNGTNLTWQFTPNFTDETYAQFENLTLVVYPVNTELENRTDLNTTSNWNINITHTNSPIAFSRNIGDKGPVSYNNDITINLSEHFSDIDYSDVYYNQTVNFTISSNSSSSSISASVSSWTLTLSSSIAVTEILNITGNDSSSTVSSNNFEIEFTTPTTTPTPTPSGGGSSTIPVSLKIIMPDPVSAYQRDRIVVPIVLYNNGKKTLSGIDLTGMATKDNLVSEDINVSFDKSSFSSLTAGQKENITLTIDVDTTQIGTFEITINANVTSPKYHDWGKLYLTIKEGENLVERLLFIEEFIAENPECAELTEIVNEAKEYFKKGDFINTVLKINQAIDACKKAISQPGIAKARKKLVNKLYDYLLIATLVSFFVGVTYYFYRRIKLKRGSSENLKQGKDILNKTFLVAGIGLIGLFAVNAKITGLAVNNIFSINGFNLSFIFIIGILGFLIFLNKKQIKDLYVSFTMFSKKQIKGFHVSLALLKKKKVYTGSGDYIGKVEDVILGKNKINSLKIKLDNKVKKKNKIKFRGIIVKYKQVKGVGHILIIKEGILNKGNL